MWSATFWKSTIERAVKTFAQALAVLAGAAAVGLMEAPWGEWLSTASMMAVASVLTSLGSAGVGHVGSASLVVQERPIRNLPGA
jgi:hypothetical protein